MERRKQGLVGRQMRPLEGDSSGTLVLQEKLWGGRSGELYGRAILTAAERCPWEPTPTPSPEVADGMLKERGCANEAEGKGGN